VRASGVPVDVVIVPGVLAPQHRFFRVRWGSLAHDH
jgi:hypothetical protein